MMSFEMDYTNLLTMLAQSNVKPEAAARGAKETAGDHRRSLRDLQS